MTHQERAALREELIAAYANGESLESLVARSRYSLTYVVQILKHAQTPLRTEPKPSTRSQQIADAYRAGSSVAEIALTFKAHPNYVYYCLRQHQVELRARKAIEARSQQIIAAYQAGGTIRTVGEQFGITHQCVQQMLEYHHIPRRGKGRPGIPKPPKPPKPLSEAQLLRQEGKKRCAHCQQIKKRDVDFSPGSQWCKRCRSEVKNEKAWRQRRVEGRPQRQYPRPWVHVKGAPWLSKETP